MDKSLRKRKTKNPCGICGLHLDRCICVHIPRLDLRTRVSLLVHAKELKRTTNTGRLAVHALINSKMYIRGSLEGPPDLSDILSTDYQAVVLYPSEGAVDIGAIQSAKPLHLIVSDGNWRQASKINSRYPEFEHLPRVKISRSILAKEHLRREHFHSGLSTLEAVARALADIEGREAVQPLMDLYQAKLQATLQGRPKKARGR